MPLRYRTKRRLIAAATAYRDIAQESRPCRAGSAPLDALDEEDVDEDVVGVFVVCVVELGVFVVGVTSLEVCVLLDG